MRYSKRQTGAPAEPSVLNREPSIHNRSGGRNPLPSLGPRPKLTLLADPLKASGKAGTTFRRTIRHLARSTRLWLACLPFVLVLVAAHAAWASPHVFSYSIIGSGSDLISNPTDVAVDNSTGPSAHDIYVADPTNSRIEKFTAQGSFLLMFGRAVNTAKVEEGRPESEQNVCVAGETCQSGTAADGSFAEPSLVAVDGSGGSSAGDVYVAGDRLISKFTSTGQLVTSWQTDGQLNFGGLISGLTVDNDGNLLVLEDSGPATIYTFDESGRLISHFATPGLTGGGIAVDSESNIYMVTGDGAVEKYSSSGTELGTLESGISTAEAINPSNNIIYVAEASPAQVTEFSSSCAFPNCTPTASFGEGDLTSGSWPHGIAVDATDGTVYVASKPPVGKGLVLVFLPAGIVPEATTGPSQPGHPSAVTGELDSANAGVVTGCHFEFVPTQQFETGDYAAAKSAPCTPAPPYSGVGLIEVRSELPQLQPHTEYTYRLVVNNSRGQRSGASRNLVTLSSPGAFTGPATVNGTSVAVHGAIQPEFGETITGCSFEYIDQASYSASGYEQAKSVVCSPALPYVGRTAVTSELSGLRAGTTYQYRVTAANVERSSVGSTSEFTTPQAQSVSGSAVEEEVEKGGRQKILPRRPVRCSKRACTRILRASMRVKRWASPRFPLNYGTIFAVYVKGHSLRVSDLAEYCVGTFSGRGLLATLDECRGRFQLIYLGSGPFRIRWRVFR